MSDNIYKWANRTLDTSAKTERIHQRVNGTYDVFALLAFQYVIAERLAELIPAELDQLQQIRAALKSSEENA